MALTSVVPSYALGMTSDLIPSNLSMMSYSPFHPNPVTHPNQLGFNSSPNVPNGLLLAAQGTSQNPYVPPITLNNNYYTGTSYPNNIDSLCFMPSNDATLLNTFHTYPTPVNIPPPHITCKKLFQSSQNALLSNVTSDSASQAETIVLHSPQEPLSTLTTCIDETCQSHEKCPHPDVEIGQQNSVQLVMRLLMSGKEVGSIIGKRGENVKKYREESGARINISDGSSPERIVTITGTPEQIYVAFSLMSRKFEDDFTQGLIRMGDENVSCPPVTLRLLVPVTQCGSIIGKGGSKIKDVRELTGASIQVASEALPTSTERTVTISGTAESIAKCIQHLCDIFLECPIKGPVILYRPKPAVGNQTFLCSAPPFSSGLLHPNMTGHSLTASDNSHDSTYGNSLFSSNPLLSVDGTASSSSTLNRSYASTFGIPSNILPLNGTTAVAPTYSNPNTITSPLTVISPGSSMHPMSEFIGDSVQLFAALNQPDLGNFSSQFTSVLAPLPANPVAAGLHSVGPPISISELALNPAMLGCYPTAGLPIVGSSGNFVYSAPANLLKVSNRISEDQFPNSNNINENISNHGEMCAGNSVPSVSQNGANGLSIGSVNNFYPSVASLDPNRSIPGLQNNSSLLGLPSLSIASVLNAQRNAMYVNASSDETVVREMIISNDVIGCIIGRGGTTINEIRNASKAQIKISNCEDGAKERKITVSGKLDSVNLAQFLINSSIAIHQEMWAFNFRLASFATALMTGMGVNSNVITTMKETNINQSESINSYIKTSNTVFDLANPYVSNQRELINKINKNNSQDNENPNLTFCSTLNSYHLKLKSKPVHRIIQRSKAAPY